MEHGASHFGGRLEHESPPGHARMRQHERRRVEHQFIVQQEIKINRSRSPSLNAPPAQAVFDCLRQANNSCGPSEVSAERLAVEKPSLSRRAADRQRLAPGTDGGYGNLGMLA